MVLPTRLCLCPNPRRRHPRSAKGFAWSPARGAVQWQMKELLARETGRQGIAVLVRSELVVEIALDGVQSSTR
jgi:hypothetical protein